MNIISIYRKFPTQESCLAHLEAVKWKGKPTCPYCKNQNSTAVPKEHRHHCNTCNTSFSVTVGTIFHNTKMDLQKWFLALSLILNAKKGISARQLGRDLEVHRNTAWYAAMRIRVAMIDQGELLKGVVEMDETYVGGKPRKGTREKLKRGRGTKKVPVVGMVERSGKVVARVCKILTAKKLTRLIRQNVNIAESRLVTDEFKGYAKVAAIMEHSMVRHATTYADGPINTNSIESFWSLLKRGMVGQYHKVSVGYLQTYVNEFAFRYNNRKNQDVFNLTISQALGV